MSKTSAEPECNPFEGAPPKGRATRDEDCVHRRNRKNEEPDAAYVANAPGGRLGKDAES